MLKSRTKFGTHTQLYADYGRPM